MVVQVGSGSWLDGSDILMQPEITAMLETKIIIIPVLRRRRRRRRRADYYRSICTP
jgi:hypothetical protein